MRDARSLLAPGQSPTSRRSVMRSPRVRPGAVAAAAAALFLLTLPRAAAAAGVHQPAAGRGAAAGPGVVVVPQHPGPPGVRVAYHPLLAEVRGRAADGSPVLAAAAPAGYTAAELRGYLRLHGSGAGQTVAIVDGFDNPYAAGDRNAYSAKV